MSPRLVLALPVLLVPVLGCGSGAVPIEEPPPPPPRKASSASSRARPAAPANPDARAAGSTTAGAPTRGADGSVVAAGLRIRLPDAATLEAPASSMRALQASLPGAAPGDEATVALFFFGAGVGGDPEANIQRWVAQIEIPGGAAPERGTLQAAPLEVRWVDASGTLLPSMMGAGPKEPVPDSRLLAAVVLGEGGPWFLKVTGPGATVAAHRDALMDTLASLAPAP